MSGLYERTILDRNERTIIGHIPPLSIDRHDDALFRQVYAARARRSRSTTACRHEAAGDAQPAAQLALSRTAIVAAYEQLAAEGYTTGRVGSGTYVVDDQPASHAGAAARGEDGRPIDDSRPRLVGRVDVTLLNDARRFNLGRRWSMPAPWTPGGDPARSPAAPVARVSRLRRSARTPELPPRPPTSCEATVRCAVIPSRSSSETEPNTPSTS